MLPDTPNPDADPRAAALARLAADPGTPLPELFRRACEALADALGADRVGVWLFVDEGKRLRCVNLYDRPARRHAKGVTWPADDPSPAGRLDAPLVRAGRVVGVACCEAAGPARVWAEADRAFARRVADLLADRMRAAEVALRARVPDPPPAPSPAARHAPGLAHDFRNALSEVLANAELIARTPDLPPTVPDRVDRIAAAAARGVGLLRGLLPAADETREHQPLPPG